MFKLCKLTIMNLVEEKRKNNSKQAKDMRTYHKRFIINLNFKNLSCQLDFFKLKFLLLKGQENINIAMNFDYSRMNL